MCTFVVATNTQYIQSCTYVYVLDNDVVCVRIGCKLLSNQIMRALHCLLEQQVNKLADQRGMYDLIPFIVDDEQKRMKKEIEGKDISVIFDGTTRLGEALAIIVRFVDDWEIVQRLVRVQLLVKSMSGKEITRELVNALSVEYGVAINCWLQCMTERKLMQLPWPP